MVNKNQGISLLELMLVIFIFSMISMFAFPTYKSYLQKIYRIEAKTALFDLANRLENYFHTYNTYINATIGQGQITDVLASNTSISNRYILNILATSKSSYIIQASLINSNIDDDCASFTLTNNGTQSAEGKNKEHCWE